MTCSCYGACDGLPSHDMPNGIRCREPIDDEHEGREEDRDGDPEDCVNYFNKHRLGQ